MRRPTWSFWVLLACTVALGGFIFVALRHGGPSAAEPQFRERLFEAELRIQEASFWVVKDMDPSELRTRLAGVADEAAALARAPGCPPFVREQVGALWLVYGQAELERHPSREEAILDLLPPEGERGPLGAAVAQLAGGHSPHDLAGLVDVPMTEWLRSRLHAFIESRDVPLDGERPHAREEQRFLEHFAVLGLGYVLMGVGGLVLLLGLPYFWRKAAAWTRVLAPPHFAPELWAGAQVLMAWFVFYAGIQLALAGLERVVPGLEDASPAVVGFFLQLAHGAVGILCIARFGMDDGPVRLREALHELRVGLDAYGGQVLRPLVLGLAGYGVAIPVVWLAAFLQSLLPIDSHLVTNPVLPLLANPPGAVSQVLLIASVVALAPFFEECLFRGFLYRHLRARLGVAGAVVVSAALFSAIHLDMGTLLPLFALGVVLALVAERAGGLMPSMLVHGLWNGTQVLLTVTVFGG